MRISLGACSVRADVDKYLDFVWEEYRDAVEVVEVSETAEVWDVLGYTGSRMESTNMTEIAGDEIEVPDLKSMEKGRLSRWQWSVMELVRLKRDGTQ